MLLQIAWFEIRYWLRSWMLWIFTLIIAAMIFGAVSSDHIVVGNALSNTFHNAPFVIENYYSIIGLLTLLMVTAFVNSAAARDFSYNTFQIIFSTPIKRRDFIFGRFLGSTLISVIPMTGVSIGILLAKYMPWVDPERWGPVLWSAHLKGLLIFAVPNTFFIAAILFTVALLARNDIVAFIGGLLLLTGYVVSAALTQNLEREQLAALLDPFAVRTFSWSPNTGPSPTKIPFPRASLVCFSGIACFGLPSAPHSSSSPTTVSALPNAPQNPKPSQRKDLYPPVAVSPIPAFTLHQNSWVKFLASVRIHFLGILKSTVFIVIVLAALLNCVPSVIFNAREGYGNSTLPVTYWILDIIAGTLYMFILIIITYYAGVLVWKDRDTRMDEIADSLPAPEWVSFLSRFVALAAMVMLVQFLALLSGVMSRPPTASIATSSIFTSLNCSVAIFCFSPVWRSGFFHPRAFAQQVRRLLHVHCLSDRQCVHLATAQRRHRSRPIRLPPDVTYSDFFGDAPYAPPGTGTPCTGYCSAHCWPSPPSCSGRGARLPWRERFTQRRPALPRRLACSGRVPSRVRRLRRLDLLQHQGYEPLLGPKESQRIQADYEKIYKPFDNQPMPRVRSIKYAIDVFPETRNIIMRGEAVI